MTFRAFVLFVIIATVFLLAYSSRGYSVSSAGENLPEVPLAQGERRPVLVELFTSEGCSSCPPADALLIRLEKEQPVEGAEIIPLGFHVDYWDYIGWRDRFSSAAYSGRQREYAVAFDRNSVYTPQMVVDGHTEFVGSDARRAARSIADATRAPKARMELSAFPGNDGRFCVQVRISDVPAIANGAVAELLLAVTEANLSSHATRGENSGRRLDHTAVVRELRTVSRVKPGESFAREISVSVNKDWKPADLRAVAFIEERSTRRILGAAQTALPSTAGY